MASIDYNVIKLTHLSPTHIGTGKENYDFSDQDLHSDTLSAALAAIRAQTGNDKEICNFLESFRISSAFPFKGNRYFLPRIAGRINVKVKGEDEHLYRKRLKGIRFIELPLWSRLANGETVEVENEQLQRDILVCGTDEFSPVSKSGIVQRVSVPRFGEADAEPFFFEWKFYSPDSGLFCITDAAGDTLEELVSLFKKLGENGIGTDKNVGGGKFDVEVSTISLEVPEDGDKRALLSLYIPDPKELDNIDLSNSRYSMILRNGYIAGSSDTKFRHLRKKSVYMFNEGSVLQCASDISGKVVDLRPDWNDSSLHSVFRSGRAFSIPIITQ